MPLERLRAPDVTFYSARDGGRLAGCGALKEIDAGYGEIKSMRTVAEYRNTGVGKAILVHLLAEASARGYARVNLETGSGTPYLAARRLYEAEGFSECPPFAAYLPDANSVFMTKPL